MDILGIAHADDPLLKAASDDLRAFIGSARVEEDRYARARQGAGALADYFRDLIATRRKSPGEDFVSRMITARDEAGQLSEDELLATCMLVPFAGHETTTHLLGNALNALLDHPAQMQQLRQRLRDDPTLSHSAVEEFLRYDGPNLSVARVVSADHAIAGKRLLAGDRVFAIVSAANRDPRAFDDPQVLDIARSPNRHLAFGVGLHFWMGAPLARLEGQRCSARLLPRLDRIERSPGEPSWVDALVMRGVASLPIQLGQRG